MQSREYFVKQVIQINKRAWTCWHEENQKLCLFSKTAQSNRFFYVKKNEKLNSAFRHMQGEEGWTYKERAIFPLKCRPLLLIIICIACQENAWFPCPYSKVKCVQHTNIFVQALWIVNSYTSKYLQWMNPILIPYGMTVIVFAVSTEILLV